MMQFIKIDPGDDGAFHSILDTRRVIIGQEISDDFFHDDMGELRKSPYVFLQQVSRDYVSQVMVYAFQHDIPVRQEDKVPAWLVGQWLWRVEFSLTFL